MNGFPKRKGESLRGGGTWLMMVVLGVFGMCTVHRRKLRNMGKVVEELVLYCCDDL